jgi:CRISPR/Cas system-associated endonuclease Cas1
VIIIVRVPTHNAARQTRARENMLNMINTTINIGFYCLYYFTNL